MRADVNKEEATVVFDPKKTNPDALIQAINKETDFKASQLSTK